MDNDKFIDCKKCGRFHKGDCKADERGLSGLNALLAAVGFKQKWHICWVANLPGSNSSHGDGTYTFRPRLTASNIDDLREMLAEDTAKAAGVPIAPEQINITGMIKIAS